MLLTISLNNGGVQWCRARKAKISYETLEQAWLGAFYTFISSGRLVTPYRCGRSFSGSAEVRWRVRGNPWAFAPWVYSIGLRRHRYVGCGLWHLTKATSHALSSSMLQHSAIADSPRPILQAADFLRNQAGFLVGPARQCHSATGKPKQRFETEDECRHWIAEHLNGKGFPYRCDFGHIHISRKSWTRPVIQKAPSEC